MSYRRRGNGLGFFFSMMLAAAVVGGLLVLLGLRYTDLGAALVPQAAPRQENTPAQLVRTTQPPVLDPKQALPAKALEQATINVVKSVGPAVVMIATREQQTVLDIFFQPHELTREGLGSGVIFDKNGYILTNNHVVAGSESVREGQDGKVQIAVILSDGRQLPAEVVGTDALTDLAVIKVDGRDLTVARLGDSDRIQVGQFAVAIGNPLGENLRNTVTMGVISAVDRTLRVDENRVLRGMIQTDASINPGNSGGPLLNSDGEVVGINTAIVAQAQGIGFAIPINTAKDVAKQLIARGRVERPGLGIVYSLYDENGLARLENATGSRVPVDYAALISEVLPGSGAAAAKLRQYDLLVEVGGHKITPDFDLVGFVSSRRVGERLPVVYYRLVQGALGRVWRRHTANVRISIVR